MRLSWRWRPMLVVTALLVVLGATHSSAVDVPRLEVEAPPELNALAERIHGQNPRRLEATMELLGLAKPGPPIRVILAGEDSSVAQGTPSWVSGFAYGNLGVVVLFPDRTPAYPDSSFDELLYHELSHVLAARAAAGHALPRWFNEGLAMYIGRSWNLEDRSRMTWALLVDRRVSLASLDESFAGDRGEMRRAYAISGAFVRDLYHRFGPKVGAQILSDLALGLPFEEAFYRRTGIDFARAEERFWRSHSIWYRWVPVLTSSATLWMVITILSLFAVKRRRDRTAEIKRQWE
ncbi:MAG: hypothetical protein EP299_06295, partial [Acidobacteria bacterium]